MSTLFYRRYVPVPYNRARGYLNDALAAFATSGEPQMLTLMGKEVVVIYGRGSDPLHFDEPWSLHWHPQGGPYPDFDGQLTVRADEDYSSCALELRGTYEPPGGIAGAAFDAIVGSRIATATARELLTAIGRDIEARYDREEAAKPVR